MGCNASKGAGTPAGVPCDYAVIVDKPTADKAGLKAVPSPDGTHLIVEAVTQSAIKVPPKVGKDEVCIGDCIVAVNMTHGDAKKMLSVINDTKKGKFTLAIKKAGKKEVVDEKIPAPVPVVDTDKNAGAAPADPEPSTAKDTAPQAPPDIPVKADGTPKFDGVWNPKALINGRKLIWLVDNSEAELTFTKDNDGNDSCSLTWEGKVYSATLKEEDKLEWDDGDVWMRDANPEAGQGGAKRSQVEKEGLLCC